MRMSLRKSLPFPGNLLWENITAYRTHQSTFCSCLSMNGSQYLQLLQIVCRLVVASSCPWNESAKIDVTHSRNLIRMQQTFESDYVHSFILQRLVPLSFQRLIECHRFRIAVVVVRWRWFVWSFVHNSSTGKVFPFFLPFSYPFLTLFFPFLYPFFSSFFPFYYPFFPYVSPIGFSPAFSQRHGLPRILPLSVEHNCLIYLEKPFLPHSPGCISAANVSN